MADVITSFKLETTQFDSKLRDAAKGLSYISNEAKKAGKAFDGFTRENVEAARALGNITPSANNAKDKVKELVAAFNDAANAYNKLSEEQKKGDFGVALSASLQKLKLDLSEAKQELYGFGDAIGRNKFDGLFSGDKISGALQVFAGNMLTKAAGAVANLGSEMYGMVKQGIELAKQGEGIRIAFERLGRGDILDGLREATHGTVTDIELMKAAVKFNDFKLPLDELGTMLAFAQQKAKDTGQSVNYMVDSIVTGLGRKSLLILDNLGLSATEVKEKMKETGDMTKAVGQIIREQMSKAGEYVETAADRAAQANVDLQNKMEELGRKFAPLQEASNNLWTSMRIGILDIVGGPLAKLLNQLTEAGRMANQYGIMGGSSKVGRMVSNLSNTSEENRQGLYKRQVNNFIKYISEREQYFKDVRAWQGGERNNELETRIGAISKKYGILDTAKIKAEIDAAKKMLAEYQQSAASILKPIQKREPEDVVEPESDKQKQTTTSQPKELSPLQQVQKQITDLSNEALTADDGRLEVIKQEIAVLNDQVKLYKEIQDYVNGSKKISTVVGVKPDQIRQMEEELKKSFTGVNLSEMIRDLKSQIANSEIGSDFYNSLTSKIADATALQNLIKVAIEKGIDPNNFNVKSLWEALLSADGISDEQLQEVVDYINQFMGEHPIKLNVDTGSVSSDGKDTSDSWKEAAKAVQSVGQAFSQIEDPAAKVAGTLAQAIASVALGYATATTQAASMGPWAWVAFAAAGLAQMVATISTIKSVAHFAEGGIVGGNDYTDNTLIGVSSGELILNKAQQNTIASQLQEGQQTQASRLPYVTGEKVVLGINNWARSTGRGQLVFSKEL